MLRMSWNFICTGIPLAAWLSACLVLAQMSYATTGIPGDYSNDGVVDAADYVLWRKAEGENVFLPNNPISAMPIGSAHYDVWRSNFGITSGTSAAPQLNCDYNGNGVCDAADYVVWRKTVGTNDHTADGSRNGIVDAADHIFWMEGFGNVLPGTSSGIEFINSSTVPEPGAAVIALLGGTGFFLNLRCRRCQRPVRLRISVTSSAR